MHWSPFLFLGGKIGVYSILQLCTCSRTLDMSIELLIVTIGTRTSLLRCLDLPVENALQGWTIGGKLRIFKPHPPVGAGGGYMFSGRPSMPPSVRASVRASVIHVVVLCFRDISSICWRIFAKLLSLVHLGREMYWLDFGVKRSKFKVTA